MVYPAGAWSAEPAPMTPRTWSASSGALPLDGYIDID